MCVMWAARPVRSMRLANTATVALVGGETLIGREIRDVLATSKTGLDLKLLAGGEEETGALTEQAGEPAVITLLNAENLRGAGAVLLAGSAESSRKVLEMGIPGTLIDLTYTAEEHPRARVRAPIVETEGPHSAGSAVYVTAHPEAIALALFLN